MAKTRFSTILAGFLLATPLIAGQAGAEDFAAGREEYMAACHGDMADGNGPTAEMFKEPVPNLTGTAARNDGIFPTDVVMEIIDGRSEVRGHGSPMPVFGNRFVYEQVTENTFSQAIANAEHIARARVVELVFYLRSIQD